jgi:NTE family protein
MTTMDVNPGAPTAFVLAGGGSLGAVEVETLRLLTEAGTRPDLVAGSSVGAINGCATPQGPIAG